MPAWEDVAAWLGRPEPFLHDEDIVLGSWRRRDPDRPLIASPPCRAAVR